MHILCPFATLDYAINKYAHAFQGLAAHDAAVEEKEAAEDPADAVAAVTGAEASEEALPEPTGQYTGEDLVYAAENDDVETIKLLVKVEQIDVNYCREDTYGALHMAAFAGHANAVTALLELGADPMLLAELDGTALMCAAQSGYVNAVEALLQVPADASALTAQDQSRISTMLSATMSTGETALYLAAQNGMADVVAKLLEILTLVNSQQVVNLTAESGATAVSVASSQGQVEALEALCKYKPHIDLSIPLETGETPLHLACSMGNKKCLEVLVKAKADPNCSRPGIAGHQGLLAHEVSPLWWAAFYDQIENVRLLMHAGATPDISPELKWRGYTEAMVASLAGDFDTLKVMFESDQLPSLVATNADGETVEDILRIVHQLTLDEALAVDLYANDVLPEELRDRTALDEMTESAYNTCDIDGDAVVDWTEFRDYFTAFGLKTVYGPKFQQLLELQFMRMDKNGDWVIELNEFADCFEKLLRLYHYKLNAIQKEGKTVVSVQDLIEHAKCCGTITVADPAVSAQQLLDAAAEEDVATVIRLVVRCGVDPNTAETLADGSVGEKTALCEACKAGSSDVVQALLALGASAYLEVASSNTEDTLLHLAAASGKPDIVKMLLVRV